MILTENLDRVTLEKSEANVTGKIGLSWVYHCMKHFGVEDILKRWFPGKKSNREIEGYKKLMAGALMLISGGEKIEDIEVLRKDKALVESLGLKSMISPDTLLDYLGIKGNGGFTRKAQEEIIIQAMKRDKKHNVYTYDNDGTYWDSEKDCASYSYKGTKQMSAMLGFIPELSNMCVTMDYRTGSVSPREGVVNQTRKAIKLAKEAGKKIDAVRTDSAGHNGELMDLCNKEGCRYFISLVQNQAVMECIGEVKKGQWQAVSDQVGREWAESTYVMRHKPRLGKEKYLSMRILILRWDISGKDSLFPIYKYHVIATNDNAIEPIKWLEFHNGRMGSENNNKECKYGFSCEYMPCQDFVSNRNYFMMVIFAYNLVQLMKMFYLGEPAKNWTIKTIRHWFINVCGKFMKRSRQLKCKIINATDLTYSLFEHCLSRLVICCA